MIKLSHASKVYSLGDTVVTALDNVSMEVKDGEYMAILGSSGSGKSTLMHVIGLLDKPTSGEIDLFGKKTSKLGDNAISALRNQYIGFVFQQYNLIDRLTVLENILLPVFYSKKHIDFNPEKKAEEVLKRIGIYERKDFYPNKISGGQQQRAALARALIMNPKLILADEPTGNLDSKSGEEILKLFEELNRELKVTVVLVTHEKEIALRTRRQVYIKDGKIVKEYL